jgi:hypothetical protein
VGDWNALDLSSAGLFADEISFLQGEGLAGVILRVSNAACNALDWLSAQPFVVNLLQAGGGGETGGRDLAGLMLRDE